MKTALLVALLAITACQDDYPRRGCAVNNAVEELPWLQAYIDELPSQYWRDVTVIHQAYLFNEPVFVITNCCPNCLSIYPVLNCQGELICNIGDCPEGFLKIKNVVWQSENSICNT